MVNENEDDLGARWHDLMGAYHRTSCALDRELLARHGITVSEFEVLQQLFGSSNGDGKVRMQELGEQVHLTQSALSRLISRLEKTGLVERGMCLDDRRSVWTKITEPGARLYLEAKPTQRAVLREHVADCAPLPAD